MDYARRLLASGIQTANIGFPLPFPECLLIEPTETEHKESLDNFVEAMKAIRYEAGANPDLVKSAPHAMPVKQLDDKWDVRDLNLAWKPENG